MRSFFTSNTRPSKQPLLFCTLLLLLLLFFSAPSFGLSEIHIQTNTREASITKIFWTNPFLFEPSPQQPPSTPFTEETFTFSLDGRFLSLRTPTESVIEVSYRPDGQVDKITYPSEGIVVYYRYREDDVLTAQDYYSLINADQLLQRNLITFVPYTGDNSFLRDSLLQTFSIEVNGQRFPEPYVDRLLPEQYPSFPQDFDAQIKAYWGIYGASKLVEREEYYEFGKLLSTDYYIYTPTGSLITMYRINQQTNAITYYQRYTYHACPNNRDVIRSVALIDKEGVRIGEYKYDMRDPCDPLANVYTILDQKTRQPMATLRPYY